MEKSGGTSIAAHWGGTRITDSIRLKRFLAFVRENDFVIHAVFLQTVFAG
jgi:hypothetical protein